MKRADIRPGVVYGYQESSDYGISQVVFLDDLERLWTVPARSNRAARSHRPKPGKGQTYGILHGYLVAVGTDVSGASLADATENGVGLDDRPFRYRVLIHTRAVKGPYDEVLAAYQAAKEAERQQRDREQAARDSDSELVAAAIAVLRERGVSASRGGWNGRMLEISPREAEKLIALLAPSPMVMRIPAACPSAGFPAPSTASLRNEPDLEAR